MSLQAIIRKITGWLFGKAMDKGIEMKMKKAQEDAMKKYGIDPASLEKDKDNLT